MRLPTLFLFIIFCNVLNANEDPYKNYRTIDTTQYKTTGTLYLYDLTIKESHNAGKVILEWKNQKNITYHMIEMRDPDTNEVIYRQKHYTNIAEFPKNGLFTIYPLHYKQQGEPISINLTDAKARNYKPISPNSYYRAVKKEEQAKQRDKKRIEQEYLNEQLRIQAADERANRITPKAIILIMIVLFIATLLVLTIWLVSYIRKDRTSQINYRKNNQGWN
ncbi:hypothetical protein [uncultured Nonlabens sp.]|uniref:hypothetical protein n=1 Tax=uncultured Nonlabens sp. TaxID=859306 RepID=UPI00261910B9|nr:hypothetical protein [uncultured Nonlabens sp.]